MSSNKARFLLAGILFIIAADGLLLVRETQRAHATSNRPFQHAVNGFGTGASVAPTWSFFSMDARIERSCENELQPIPGLVCPNPTHGATLADLPPLDKP